MSWRLKIRHTSGYQYQSPVSSSYNEARITPLTTDAQVTIESRINIQPVVRSFRYWDYWGTQVHAFDLHRRHTELVVTGSSLVETSDPPAPLPSVGWDDLAVGAADLVEYLLPTSHVPLAAPPLELRDLRSCRDPGAAIAAAAEWIRAELTYEPGATKVSTSATEALEARRGVCQDFVHVFLSIARSVGIPSRYVSGYLHPIREPHLGTTERGQSHAWAEVWLGGWVALDPTNGEVPGLRHVVVARGRDYRDVAPLRGIYSGGAAHALEVEVELTRIA